MPPLTTGSLPVGAVNALTPSDPLNPHDMTEHDERHSQTFVQVPVREELLLEAPGCFHPAALPISSTVPVTTLPNTIHYYCYGFIQSFRQCHEVDAFLPPSLQVRKPRNTGVR